MNDSDSDNDNNVSMDVEKELANFLLKQVETFDDVESSLQNYQYHLQNNQYHRLATLKPTFQPGNRQQESHQSHPYSHQIYLGSATQQDNKTPDSKVNSNETSPSSSPHPIDTSSDSFNSMQGSQPAHPNRGEQEVEEFLGGNLGVSFPEPPLGLNTSSNSFDPNQESQSTNLQVTVLQDERQVSSYLLDHQDQVPSSEQSSMQSSHSNSPIDSQMLT